MPDTTVTELKLGEERSKGAVSAILMRPAHAFALYVMAHGAGADMRHKFMETLAIDLAAAGVATLRFNFPYTEAKRAGINPQPVLEAYVRSACAKARELEPDLPLFGGGKSMGGRMMSNAAAKEAIEGLRGIIFLGFPLHAPNKPGRDRAAHLLQVGVPMLFLQGTRDDLADLDLMREVSSELGERATLHIVDGGNHSFDVPKRTGRTALDVRQELTSAIVQWMRR